MSKIIGIDLGTANSVVAVMEDTLHQLFSCFFPVIVPW